ncbi:ABC transporter ATP-binding protein [Clostridium sp. MSJ-11]|uniref:ABC transporter ATP-binding protein n=1 Tax=Clostridium mobile TaxID=2841512 RepID=A0ABS6EDZ4_9CLOT|nr:ABC transporter ATP-binding protein [Clostridium mobile]MBU5483423.1 ABC transporter ATP-binding protein [Clostridium mobile]
MEKVVVKTTNLTRKYGKKTSVNKINLSINKGEIYGFLGPNGAGKSTTIKMLLGLVRPTHGEIKIFGENFKENRLNILKKIGSLVEYPSYYGHLTGYENLEAVRRLINAPQNRIDEVLNIVRLTKESHRLTKEYSLGMKQRLGIATSLLNQPELLILDEPTNGLDPAGIQEIRELIKEFPKKYGMTVIVSSHLLSEIDQIATQVGIINNGNLIFQDSINTLRNRGHSQLKIQVDNIDKASDLLNKLGARGHLENNCIWLPNYNCSVAAKINRLFINNGISVYKLEEVKQSLENIFLELIGKGISL